MLLRLTMLRTYPPELGYDFADHWAYIEWMARHWSIPPLADFRLANHPPLFYALAAVLTDLGAGPRGVQVISVVAGVARLALVWVGLAWLLPHARVARLTGLALAAVLPVAVHIDGTVSGESLCATLVAGALVVLPLAFGEGRRSVVAGAGVGTLLGLAIVTKISAMTVVVTLALVVLVQAIRAGGAWRARARRLVPWLVALVALLATAGWYFAYNQRHYGKPLVSGFDAPTLSFGPATEMIPLAFRRPPEFFVGWSAEIYAMPFYPSASLGRARFLPQLVASTFVDYYNHSFAVGRPDARAVTVNERPLPLAVVPFARGSVIAGTAVAALAATALAAGVVRAWLAGAWAPLAVLLVPVTGLGGQAAYALAYPHDWLGVVKGAYLLYAATPMFATFGIAVESLAGRRATRPLAALALIALALVAAYTIRARSF